MKFIEELLLLNLMIQSLILNIIVLINILSIKIIIELILIKIILMRVIILISHPLMAKILNIWIKLLRIISHFNFNYN